MMTKCTALAVLTACALWAGCGDGSNRHDAGEHTITDLAAVTHDLAVKEDASASGDLATSVCGPGTLQCGASCVDVTVDPQNCGSCDHACTNGQVCSSGMCALTCVGGTTLCGSTCVDTNNDPNNCGGCGADGGTTACIDGQVCVAGTCAIACPAGQIKCGDKCVDPTSDIAFCGASNDCAGANAGSTCDPSLQQVCSSGKCQTKCATNQIQCGDKCVDPTSDNGFCGASGTCDTPANQGTPCGAGTMCSNSTCQPTCGAPQIQCGNGCVDPSSSVTFCGASGDCKGTNIGTTCASHANAIPVCAAGACNFVCTAGFGDCTAADGCETNLASSNANCGACGNACASDATCVSSVCRPNDMQLSFTGAEQSFVVPNGAKSITIQAYGAQGGVVAAAGASGLGGFSQGTITVTAGSTIYVDVGGMAAGATGGFNGGGNAGGIGVTSNYGKVGTNGAGGGGASDVRIGGNGLSNRVLVAAGGGGGGGPGCSTGNAFDLAAAAGGNGGSGASGADGITSAAGAGGGGGMADLGGAGGPGCSFVSPSASGVPAGGYNGCCCQAGLVSAGGGGGGLPAGGGGGGPGAGTTGCSLDDTGSGGGGGGGTSYVTGLTSTTTTDGVQSGDGSVKIIFNY